ncbi:hypothetical protein JL722_4679 [Aureococcus anophagefferens]|nr:hypothetical protein JL722_4679 [Aureococcus anophagefferens]
MASSGAAAVGELDVASSGSALGAVVARLQALRRAFAPPTARDTDRFEFERRAAAPEACAAPKNRLRRSRSRRREHAPARADLYKKLLTVGRDYPAGLDHVRDRAKREIFGRRDIEGEVDIKKAVRYGRYMLREMMGVIQLKKYRTLKARYAPSDDDEPPPPPPPASERR